MNYLSEVLKILDAALRHNVDQASRYAALLASKLENDGEQSQARAIRERLARVPKSSISAAGLEGLPVDRETRSALLEEELPEVSNIHPVFAPGVAKRFEEFISSVQRFEELRAAGVHLPPRMLIYGPPGCGKTMAARIITSELDLPLLTVRCDALVSSLLGQTGRNLREVFTHAAERPCVLFLDEFDALGKSRAHQSDVGELQRVVISMLQNLDALPSETVVIAATNHEELLDRAVWRRFSFVVPIDLPSIEQRLEMWRVMTKPYIKQEKDLHTLAELSEGMSGAAIQTVVYDVLRDVVLTRNSEISLPLAVRRLAKIKWMADGVLINDDKVEMRALRGWAPKIFTWKALEDMFDMSVRQVQKTLGESNERSGETDPLRASVTGGLHR